MVYKTLHLKIDASDIAKRKRLEEKQKIEGWGVESWPSSDNVSSEEESSCDSKHAGKKGKKKMSEGKRRGGPVKPITVPQISVVCRRKLPMNEYSCAPPGCIGFNGHQAVFHCYKPGKAYLAKSGPGTDRCQVQLATLPTGEQCCTLLYEKPPPPPVIKGIKPCRTERECITDVIVEPPPPEKPKSEKEGEEKAPAKKGKEKGGKKGKKGGKKGKKK